MKNTILVSVACGLALAGVQPISSQSPTAKPTLLAHSGYSFSPISDRGLGAIGEQSKIVPTENKTLDQEGRFWVATVPDEAPTKSNIGPSAPQRVFLTRQINFLATIPTVSGDPNRFHRIQAGCSCPRLVLEASQYCTDKNLGYEIGEMCEEKNPPLLTLKYSCSKYPTRFMNVECEL